MASSARFGRVGIGEPGFSVVFNTNSLIRLTDSVTGQFREGTGNFQRALSEANDKAALKVAEAMVESLQRSVKATGRKQRGTNNLAEAILHINNRDVTASSFIVGRPSWLDRSPAELYWRRIEEGDQTTFDSEILFTNLDGKSYAPWTPGGGGNSPGRFGISRPMPPGYKHMRMPQHRGVFVQNIGPFPAYHYSAAGLKALQRLQMKQRYKAELSHYGIELADVLKK